VQNTISNSSIFDDLAWSFPLLSNWATTKNMWFDFWGFSAILTRQYADKDAKRLETIPPRRWHNATFAGLGGQAAQICLLARWSIAAGRIQSLAHKPEKISQKPPKIPLIR
jgi:hypothetical protein